MERAGNAASERLHMPWTLGLALLAVLLLAATVAAEPHDPIVIEGDGALCAAGSGVVNCATADGTPERPYLIEGWIITAWPAEDACGQQRTVAILLCDVKSSVVLRDLDLRVAVGTPVDLRPAGGPSPGVGLMLERVQDVTVEDVYIETGALGVLVEGDPEADGLVRFNDLSVQSRRTASPMLELLRTRDADVHIQGALLASEGRNFGMQFVQRSAEEMRTTLEGLDLQGARVQGIQARGGLLTLLESMITMDTTARLGDEEPLSGLEAAAVSVIDGGRLEMRDSSVTFSGVGASLNDAASLMLRGNRFVGASSLDIAVEVSGEGSDPAAPCDFLADFNDIGDLLVTNSLPDCELQAPDNWWGGEGPRDDQLQGAILVPTWSPVNLGEMARVELVGPPPERIGNTLWLTGTASGPVQTLRLGGDVARAVPAQEGGFEWEVPMVDVPLRSLALRLQACSGQFCGPPVEWQAQRGASSLPPVPIAVPVPLVAAVGATVTIDASGSYSPAGLPITKYRFDDGDWQSEPRTTRVWDTPGPQTVRVEVEDRDGLRGQPIEVGVHVREDLQRDVAVSRDAPALMLLVVVLPVLALASLVRRW